MWKYGKKSGQGVYVYSATGIKLMGEWNDGLIKKGRWILPNGVYYEGEFENNKPTKAGKYQSTFGSHVSGVFCMKTGTWYFKKQNIIEGEFVQKKPEEEPVVPISSFFIGRFLGYFGSAGSSRSSRGP